MNRPSPEPFEDKELVARYLRGEKDAFHTLFAKYKSGVFMVVRHYFHNREKAEEIFQEVFMKLIERLESYDGTGSFRGWLYTLCRHHCIDRLRYLRRRPEDVESQWRGGNDDMPTPVGLARSGEVSADDRLYDRELAFYLDQALKKLPEEQRETFLLKERGGLTFEEIAQLSKVSVNTVKSRMRYALEALRRALRGKSFVKEAME